MAVYVYSVVGKQHPLRLDGLTGVGAPPSPLRTVTSGSLTAVVSDAPEGLCPRRRDLTAHQEVQDRLITDGTVLPMPFGLTAPDDDAVREDLEERATEYADRLGALEGCAEYNLKVKQDEEALLRQILEESPEARELDDAVRGGTAGPDVSLALGELVAGEVEARHASLAAGVVEALRPFARDQQTSEPAGEDFLSVSFLVAEEQEELFLTTEMSIANQLGDDFEFRLIGPLPPYGFV
ncbi:GvpL/GvpF family gas vesicle protein [Streptomyces sp. HNM0645]|uniref:GvpL/GvpF family gas vesicle protein n=1 Tax=Streptomyces sp. HNM0645 TaxID=2782343 RepID=UPI0024B79D81|nr:GvpL/GvpF family gas vesicle protein [Streptomyces sp. HNM0645]MDI9885525.1 GvpL/GvpF family gas vesicle protein [Streptomyces sp. HNM0645]